MVEFEDDERRVGSDRSDIHMIENGRIRDWMPPIAEIIEYRPRWEYTILDYDSLSNPTNDNQIIMLNALGAEGWELVETREIERTRWGVIYRAIFKRMKEDACP